MKGWLKWTLAGGALILSLPLLLMLFFDQSYFKQKISDAVEARTGRPLIMQGELKLIVGLTPKLSAESIRYPNAPWGSHAWAIEVPRAVVAVDLIGLLRGQLLVDNIILEKPVLRVEINSSGNHNLNVLRRRSGARRASLPWGLEISGAEIVDGEISVATNYRHWAIRIHQARATSAAPGKPVMVDFRGMVEETPITATATLGSFTDLFTFQPTALSIDGQVGDSENRVRATGNARNLLKWIGVDLAMDFDIARVDQLSKLARTALSNICTVRGTARFHQPERLRTMTLREINLRCAQWGLANTLNGEIANLYNRTGIALDFSTTGNLAQSFGGLVEWSAPGEVATPLITHMTAELRGSARNLRMRIESAKVENASISIEAHGEVGLHDGAWRGALPISLTVNKFGAAKSLSSRVLSPIGPLTAVAGLTHSQGAWGLNEVKWVVQREALKIEVTGAIDDLTNRPWGRLHVSAVADDGRYLQPLLADSAQLLPAMETLTLAADIDFADGAMRASVDKLAGKIYGIDFTASGIIAELNRWRGIDFAINGKADESWQPPIFAGNALSGKALPGSGPVRVAARLADDESGTLHFTDITASLTAAAMKLVARGEIRNLGTSMRADLGVELTLTDAKPAQAWFANSPVVAFLQAVTPLTASANLYSQGVADWRIRDFRATSLTDGAATSASGEVTAFAPLDARLHVAINDLAVSKLPVEWKIPRPHGGMLDLSMDLTARRGDISAKNITAALISPTSSMLLHGDIDRLSPIAINNMALKFEASSVAALEWHTLSALNPDNPISGKVTVLAVDAGNARADVAVAVGQNDLHGTLNWRWPGDNQAVPRVRARVDGDFLSERFYLAEILAATTKSSRFFSPARLNTDWIHQLDGRIELNATGAGSRQLSMRTVNMQIVLDNGRLRQKVSGKMGQGALEMHLVLDANTKPFSVEFKMHGEDLNAEDLVAFRHDDFVENGIFEADLEFAASGQSMAELAAAANGRVWLRLDGARMKNQELNVFGGDIFTNLVTAINPFRSVGEYVDIQCAVIAFDIDNGVATSKNNLAIKTDKVTLLGGGKINLSDESLNILITPKARRGFGINLSSLAKIMRLDGTLAKPKIEADASRLLETGAAVWAGLYSGGLSLIAQGLFDRIHANTDVCRTASEINAGDVRRNATAQPGADG